MHTTDVQADFSTTPGAVPASPASAPLEQVRRRRQRALIFMLGWCSYLRWDDLRPLLLQKYPATCGRDPAFLEYLRRKCLDDQAELGMCKAPPRWRGSRRR
jgi:hypothetical protein